MLLVVLALAGCLGSTDGCEDCRFASAPSVGLEVAAGGDDVRIDITHASRADIRYDEVALQLGDVWLSRADGAPQLGAWGAQRREAWLTGNDTLARGDALVLRGAGAREAQPARLIVLPCNCVAGIAELR